MNTNSILSLLLVVAIATCARAGIIGPSTFLHEPHHHHHPHPIYPGIPGPGPLVKHLHPAVYSVPPPPPEYFAKHFLYGPPFVKVLPAPPVIKTVAYAPFGYGAYGGFPDHHHPHHHHDHQPFLL